MTLVLAGQLTRVQERQAGTPGNTWTEQTLVVQDWGQTIYATVGRDFGELPKVGSPVVLAVAVRPYVRGKDGTPGVGYTALHETALADLLPSRQPAQV